MASVKPLMPRVDYPKWIYKDTAKLTGGVVVADADEEQSVLAGWLAEADAELALATDEAPASDDDGLTKFGEPVSEAESATPEATADDAPRKRGRPRKFNPDIPEE